MRAFINYSLRQPEGIDGLRPSCASPGTARPKAGLCRRSSAWEGQVDDVACVNGDPACARDLTAVLLPVHLEIVVVFLAGLKRWRHELPLVALLGGHRAIERDLGIGGNGHVNRY